MENSGVSARLVLGEFLFFLDNHNGLVGKIFAQAKRRGQANNASSNYTKVCFCHWVNTKASLPKWVE
jgi:hypothetical protein